MIGTIRVAALNSLVGAITVTLLGCDDKVPSPVAPSPVPSQVAAIDEGDVGTTADGGGTAELKADAPTPIAPSDDAEVEDLMPILTVSNARGRFVDAHFGHEFALYEFVNGSSREVAVGPGTPVDLDVTAYQVPEALERGVRYAWRARAVLDGVYGPWSLEVSFRIATVSLGVPRPLAPVERATVGTRPVFTVRNPAVDGNTGRVFIQIEVSPEGDFARGVLTARTHSRARGETNLQLSEALAVGTRYFWRARARTSVGSSSEVVSAWSATARFVTEEDSSPGPAGPFGPGGAPPNLLRVVQEVAARHPDALRSSCRSDGGTWRFMDLAVQRLREKSGRWGYNCRRGNCNDPSEDAVAYYRGPGTTIGDAQGSTDVAIIDIIYGHCGSMPRPSWGDVTQATADAGSIGRWKYPR